MKTLSFSPSSLRFIETAPLVARYDALISLMMIFISAGRSKEVLRVSYKVGRVMRLFIKLNTQNQLLERKLSMLTTPTWRERVLRELGGFRKLSLWQAAQSRIDARAAKRAKDLFQRRDPYERASYDRGWLYTPERMAESERLKAHAQLCAKACAPVNILRDRYKMDVEGEFRLAPLSRGSHGKTRQIRLYTQGDISEYNYNAIPFAKVKGLGPAAVWPIEFHAAIEAEDLTQTPTQISRIPTKAKTQTSQPKRRVTHRIWDKRTSEIADIIPLRAAISAKTYRAIFENPI